MTGYLMQADSETSPQHGHVCSHQRRTEPVDDDCLQCFAACAGNWQPHCHLNFPGLTKLRDDDADKACSIADETCGNCPLAPAL